jgi:tetratricopeptide (TPR) repeat protein
MSKRVLVVEDQEDLRSSRRRRSAVTKSPLAFVVASVLITVSLGHPALGQTTSEKLGDVHFPISCSEVQPEFDRAVALLHNFFFPETVKAFRAVIAKDPSCSMAYWGLAMSQRPNPLVPPFPPAFLKAGWEAVQQGMAAKTQSPREAGYLAAMEVFYKDYDKIDQVTRTLLYEQAMQRLHDQYTDDPEAAIFYALALNEAVDLNDKNFTRQLKAAAILSAEAQKQPNHPGIAHYLIHSYDFAPLAALCLPVAHLYDKIAATAPHALHMPSHIYSMLGMWDDSVRANLAAEAAANDYAAKNYPQATDPAIPHLLDFRIYAYLQTAKDTAARQIVDSLPKLKKFATVRLSVDTGLAAIPARYALDRGHWDEAAQLSVSDSDYPSAQAISYFARALGAARSGQSAVARAEIGHLDEIEAKLAAAKDEYWAAQTRIQKQTVAAWLAWIEGRREEAIATMREAADLDDASEKNVAMENKLVPVRALLGELYLAAGMSREALSEFEGSLKSTPNRFRSVAGAAAAARAMGSGEVARRYYRALTALAVDGDGLRAELAEARTFLSQN